MKNISHIKVCQWWGDKGGHAVVQPTRNLEGVKQKGSINVSAEWFENF
jgi:hypothetical protein